MFEIKQWILPMTIVFLAIVGTVFWFHNYYTQPKYIELNGVKVSYNDYLKAKELNKDNVGFDVTDVETGARIRFINVDNAKLISGIN